VEAFRRGRFTARLAEGPDDRARIMAQRAAVFRGGRDDADPLDDACLHVMVAADGEEGPAAAFRVLVLPAGAAPGQAYAARFYDLSPLAGWPGPVVEMGRFCLRPGAFAPDALRMAWAALTRIVEGAGAGLIIGCASFAGTDWRAHRPALALLAASHLGPPDLRPRAVAAEVVRYPELAGPAGDARAGLAALPPLLRFYLAMGGWVGDHAVVDRDLGTLHVFTCVEVAKVPPGRAASLRALAAGG